MLETLKALNTIILNVNSKNFKDNTMDNQQETKDSHSKVNCEK
jgi:hypothetical protein